MKIQVLFLLVIGVWAGMVLGLSFIEAPLKFSAPGVTTAVGLGIGRVVFNFSNNVQLIFAIVLALWLFLNGNTLPKLSIALAALILFLLFVQTIYLLPILDDRAIQTIKGIEIPHTNHHIIFIIIEIIKLITLVTLFIKTCPK